MRTNRSINKVLSFFSLMLFCSLAQADISALTGIWQRLDDPPNYLVLGEEIQVDRIEIPSYSYSYINVTYVELTLGQGSYVEEFLSQKKRIESNFSSSINLIDNLYQEYEETVTTDTEHNTIISTCKEMHSLQLDNLSKQLIEHESNHCVPQKEATDEDADYDHTQRYVRISTTLY